MSSSSNSPDYQTAISEIPNILGGFGKDYVLAALGQPNEKTENVWHYDLTKLPGYTEPVPDTGATSWRLVDIVFDRDRRVLNVVPE